MSRSKVVLLGDPETGKTRFARYLITGEEKTPNHKYRPTQGVEVHPTGKYNLWDRGTTKEFLGLGNAYNMKADGFVIFGENTKEWEKEAHGKKCFFAHGKTNEQVKNELETFYKR
uniref:Uncharacterized protein n=1 Tax=viral metagenome TaxID=1070528 RepID=A0A6C0JAW2_9ZZZZ